MLGNIQATQANWNRYRISFDKTREARKGPAATCRFGQRSHSAWKMAEYALA